MDDRLYPWAFSFFLLFLLIEEVLALWFSHDSRAFKSQVTDTVTIGAQSVGHLLSD